MIERTGDRLNQGLLVLSNDLKSNSGPLAYFRRKTRSRQFRFTVTSTRDVEEKVSLIPKHPNRWTIRGPRIALDLPLLTSGRKKKGL